MDVAVIGGTGAEGFGLTLRLAKAGHHVTIGSRSAEKGADAGRPRRVEILGGDARIDGTTNEEAAASADGGRRHGPVRGAGRHLPRDQARGAGRSRSSSTPPARSRRPSGAVRGRSSVRGTARPPSRPMRSCPRVCAWSPRSTRSRATRSSELDAPARERRAGLRRRRRGEGRGGFARRRHPRASGGSTAARSVDGAHRGDDDRVARLGEPHLQGEGRGVPDRRARRAGAIPRMNPEGELVRIDDTQPVRGGARNRLSRDRAPRRTGSGPSRVRRLSGPADRRVPAAAGRPAGERPIGAAAGVHVDARADGAGRDHAGAGARRGSLRGARPFVRRIRRVAERRRLSGHGGADHRERRHPVHEVPRGRRGEPQRRSSRSSSASR